MEFAQFGRLFDVIRNETIPADMAEFQVPVIHDIASGMAFLHSRKPTQILHRDLRSVTVLISCADGLFGAKICDLGIGDVAHSLGVVGTPLWMAPELLNGDPHTPESDVYAFGITLFELFSARLPYEDDDELDVLIAVADTSSGRGILRPELPAETPPHFVDLCRRCWHPSPSARPSFNQIVSDMDQLGAGRHAGCLASLQARVSAQGWGAGPLGGEQDRAARETEADGDAKAALLYRVFPEKVAKQLMSNQRVEPQPFECVTIFFSDIVGARFGIAEGVVFSAPTRARIRDPHWRRSLRTVRQASRT